MAGATQTMRRTRATAAGVSLVLHALVLSWLGLRVVQPTSTQPPEDRPPLTLDLVRSLPTAAPTPVSPRPRIAAPTRVEPVVIARPRLAAPVPRSQSPKPLPLPPVGAGSPGRGTAGGGGAAAEGEAVGSRPAPGPLPGVEMRGDLKGFLRGTVGCSHEEYLRLTPAERARCDAGFATAYRTAPPIPLPDDKLAGFARQADANARKRARREGSLENTLPPCPADMVGSNLGISCLPPQAHTTVGKF